MGQGTAQVRRPEESEPQPECPSRLSSMDGEQDRDREHAQGQAEDAAVPGLIGLTQGGKADSKDQDEDQESADVETKAPHGMVPESLK